MQATRQGALLSMARQQVIGIGTIRTHNQIIQAIAVDIACTGD
jgi:ribose 5-phosphate isomerase